MDRLSIETYNNTKYGSGNAAANGNSGAGVNASSVKNFYLYDGRGSVSELTGMTGNVTAKYRYDDFGKLKEIQKFNTAEETGKDNSSVLDALGNLFGITNSKDQEQNQNQNPGYHEFFAYNAESYNPNTEMQYLRARYYKPETANFLTEDSYLGDILKPLTLNRYNYCAGNPVNYKDPSGNTLMDIELQAWEKVKPYIVEKGKELANEITDTCPLSNGNSGTKVTDGKDFKDHFIRHKNLLEKVTGTKYPKYKEFGQQFLDDIGKVIDDGIVKYEGLGTVKIGQPPMKIYRGNGITIILTVFDEFVTILETGLGMDKAIQMLKP